MEDVSKERAEQCGIVTGAVTASYGSVAAKHSLVIVEIFEADSS